MLAMGIDPGNAICGYGFVELNGTSLQGSGYGVIRTTPSMRREERLKVLYDRINELIRDRRPDVVGVEKLFFNRNVTTAMTVSEARGVILLAVENNGVLLMEPTPLQVKAVRVERAAPAIRRATFSRSATGLEIQITGYSTAREVTQAVFRFSAASGSTLRTSEVTVAVEAAFSGWFNDRGVADFGSQFTFTQTFAIDGSAAAVSPVSVTLTNRLGSTTAQIAP